jgi:hypothetical protein
MPMDFEYDNKQGPVDQRSPFITAAGLHAAKKRELVPSPSRPRTAKEPRQLTKGPSFGQPGTHSQFDSPSKNAFATPNRPRLQEPDGRTALSVSPHKTLPSIPPHASPWTLRTPTNEIDFSSGGETPNTPGQDSEQATPDTQMASKMGRLMGSSSPKKGGRRESLFKRISNWGSPSPAKESIKEMEKEVSRKHYTKNMEHRVAKRRSERDRSDRSKKKQVVLREDDEDSENEQAQLQKGVPKELSKVQQTYGASIAGFFHWIEAHPGLPSVLSWYMQFTINAFLAVSFMYLVYCAWCGIMTDVEIESSKHASEIWVEISLCAKNYRENRCDPDTRVPAMETACGNWETCMNRDPKKLARATVTARTFATIINSFFEEFSYKSMVCVSVFIFGMCWVVLQVHNLHASSEHTEKVCEESRRAHEKYFHHPSHYNKRASPQDSQAQEPFPTFHQP